MTRRQQLTEAQLAALFDPPTEQRDMVRHYTLSDCDMAMIRRCRGDHSRLGYALMLCFLRYPGRHLRAHEHPPAVLISFVAEQIDVCADGLEDAMASEQTRRRHAAELQVGSDCVRSTRAMAPNWRNGCCRMRSRMTVSRIWPNWCWKNAGSAGSSFPRRARWSGFA